MIHYKISQIGRKRRLWTGNLAQTFAMERILLKALKISSSGIKPNDWLKTNAQVCYDSTYSKYLVVSSLTYLVLLISYLRLDL